MCIRDRQDLSKTIDKEKEMKSAAELRETAIPTSATEIKEAVELGVSFTIPEDPEPMPEGMPLLSLQDDDY